MGVPASEKPVPADGNLVHPDVVPITASEFLPKAVRVATKPRPLSNPDKYVEFYNVSKVYPTPRGPSAACSTRTCPLKA